MRRLFIPIAYFTLIFLTACQNPAPPPDVLSPKWKIDAFPAPIFYDLKMEINYKTREISADCALTIKNSGDLPVPVVPLNLYRLMEVNSVADDKGVSLQFSQNVKIFEDWKELQVNHVRVKIDPPLAPGKEATLRIRYGGLLLGYTEAMRYVKDHVSQELTLIRSDSYVFPLIGIPSWQANRALGLKAFGYRVALTAPSQLVVANGGELASTAEKDGRTTWVYKDRVPSWRMDLAVSNYEILEGQGGRLKVFSFPEDSQGARELLTSLLKTMDLYGRWFGPLKVFHGLTVIEVPAGYGSQADIAAIIQEATAFKDRSRRTDFYHELSHLWSVDAKDPLPARFESEGMAMFCQHLVQEKLEGVAGAVKKAVSDSLVRMAKNFREHPEWKGVAMIDYGKKNLTDLSYRKGQILFDLLYETLGEDAFLATMGSFYGSYFETGATSGQFIEFVKNKNKAAAGLERLFEEWILTAKADELIASGVSLSEIIRRYRP